MCCIGRYSFKQLISCWNFEFLLEQASPHVTANFYLQAGGETILAGGEIQKKNQKKNLIRRFTITAKGRLNPSMTNNYLALIPSNLSFLLLAKSKLDVNGTKRGGEDGGVGKEWEIE